MSTPVAALGAARAPVVVLASIAAALGVVASFVVPAGLPYDEPAHWSTVQYVADRWSLPVLGDEGVTYEGHQAPLYYLVAAALSALLGGGRVGFVGVRLLGVAGLVLLVVLTAVLLARVTRSSTLLVVGGTAFLALNPMLIVMSASVQNDTWSLVWAVAALVVATASPARADARRGVIVGCLFAVAFLTKITVAPVALAVVGLWLLRRRFAAALGAVVASAALAGWWVVRNILLYGDLTGQAGVDRLGLDFTGGDDQGPVALIRTVITYLTLPTEYSRNVLVSPPLLDLVAVLVAAAVVVGGITLAVRSGRPCDRWGLLVIASAGALSVLAWLVQVYFGWSVAFRTAYGALPVVALAFASCTLLTRRPRVQVAILAVLVALMVVLLVWTGVALGGMTDPGLLTP